MQHSIPIVELGPQGEPMAHAVEACVHCGFCLSACPTYKVLGEEMDSPRGRIILMKEALEGSLTSDSVLPYIDRCLGCMGCVTACPSGVEYGHLLTPFRARTEQARSRKLLDAATRLLVRETLPYPGRFRMAARAGRMAKPLRGALPRPFAAMLDLLPTDIPAAQPLPALVEAQGKRRARVALLAGCVQQVVAPEIGWATIRVLARNGVEVVIPAGQGCCGSLSMHTGEAKQAESLARKNLAAFPSDVDAVITNAAGCGSGMREYPLLFRGSNVEEQATAFAAKVRDISEFLDELGLVETPSFPEKVRVAYHDACHLAHAQRVTAAPRRLLASIGNVELLEVPEGDLCCGSAGTYNLEQPEIARQLGERKASNIASVDAAWVAAGNIGCIMQIRAYLPAHSPAYLQANGAASVLHTIEVLDRAYSARSG